MSCKNRSLAVSHLLLRLSLVLALFFMLTIPHPGMTAVTETPAMTMHHTADAQNQMSHSGVVHDAMNGALCAMLCAGVATAEGPMPPARFVDFVFARWTMDAGPVWMPFQPDPAQRPPDPTPTA
jgi:hypothetical protein